MTVIYIACAQQMAFWSENATGPRDYRIPGNGRLISAWPARTGVLVQEGVAYAGVGMFPSEGVYVCAMNAENGELLWKTEQKDLPAQGYLVASSSRLYV